jgi:hypothetical protein
MTPIILTITPRKIPIKMAMIVKRFKSLERSLELHVIWQSCNNNDNEKTIILLCSIRFIYVTINQINQSSSSSNLSSNDFFFEFDRLRSALMLGAGGAPFRLLFFARSSVYKGFSSSGSTKREIEKRRERRERRGHQRDFLSTPSLVVIVLTFILVLGSLQKVRNSSQT